VYDILKLREKAKEIKIIGLQDKVYLTRAEILYKPDFKIQCTKTHRFSWVEAKGPEIGRWNVIKKLWEVYGPGELEVWKGTYRNPVLNRTITPTKG